MSWQAGLYVAAVLIPLVLAAAVLLQAAWFRATIG